MPTRTLCIPPTFAIDCAFEGNRIRQLRASAVSIEAAITPFTRGKLVGEIASVNDRSVVVFTKRPADRDEMSHELLITASGAFPNSTETDAKWSYRQGEIQDSFDRAKFQAAVTAARQSWRGQFQFSEEETENRIVKIGLRPSQVGALHAALGHWRMSEAVATIVMPTGTGKTETMLALTLHERPTRVLVIVPNDALRTQIGGKFLGLGLLRELGVCGPKALNPIVGTLRQGIASAYRLQDFVRSCNVVVSTMSLLARLSPEQVELIRDDFSHLFIDEAHHIKAKTWERFRDSFKERRILQFTATPFRNDGAHVDGRAIFTYPLRRAQEEGYFRQINLLPVSAYDPDEADEAIAKAAVEQLGKDREAGFDHLLLARTNTIPKAETLHALYERIGGAYTPVLIHSELPESSKTERLRQIRQRSSRIIVCVDMFGEGFDLPELKIAALHEVHKSLAVTLQFTGRFTRTKSTIGDATVVVNVYDPKVSDALQDLYADRANWNQILRRLSESATGGQVEKQEFIESFSPDEDDVPVQNLMPKMSAVAYRTTCSKWKPQNLIDVIDPSKLVGSVSVAQDRNVAYFVLKEEVEIEWGHLKGMLDTVYELYVFFWDSTKQLLFINTSNNDASHEQFAKAIAGNDAALVKGSQVFRVFGGLRRLLLQSLGLSHAVSRVIRFTMHVGADVPAGLSDAQTQDKVKTNVFGGGFSDGERISIGCSRKGRIWSRQTAPDLLAWTHWCGEVGAKLLNSTYSEQDILKNSIVPIEISTRPTLMPVAIEWPDGFYMRDESATQLYIGDEVLDFDRVGLSLVNPNTTSPIRFKVFSSDKSVEYEVAFSATGATYSCISRVEVEIGVGRRRKPLSQWFVSESPIIRYEKDSFSKDNQLCRPHQPRTSIFDGNKVEAWDWNGINIRVESQTIEKRADSIQYRLIERLKGQDWPVKYEVIVDDDDTHEAADVVALLRGQDELLIHFFHCKFSSADEPGARLKDLYEVCGQAQRTVQWRAHPVHLLKHLIKRDVDRVKSTRVSRFEVGGRKLIQTFIRQLPHLRVHGEVFIVQPGLLKSSLNPKQMEVLGATETYLMETYKMPLIVVGSAGTV